MKKLILALAVMALFSYSIKAQENNRVVINNLTDVFFKSFILKGVQEMSNFQITVDNSTGKKFIQGNGVTKDGNSIVFRTEVYITTDTDGEIKLMAGEIEACTGVNCSQCGFADGGGCECKKAGSEEGANTCNHSIIREAPQIIQ